MDVKHIMDLVDCGFLIIMAIIYVATSKDMKLAILDYLLIILSFYCVYYFIGYLFNLHRDGGNTTSIILWLLFINRYFKISSIIRKYIDKRKNK